MHIRSASARWIFVILCAGALWASLVAADTAPLTPISAKPGNVVLAKTDVDPQTAEPTFTPRLYTRNVAWWPYTTGPHYGDVEMRGGDLPDDVLLTHVGSFRIGQRLAIPAELTGSLSGLATGRQQYFLIQMRADSINSEWPQTLASMGATVVGRTPENGAFVRADRAAFDRLSTSPLIQFVEPYHPAYKIHPSVGRVAQATPEEAASPIFHLEVTLWPAEPAAPTADRLRQLGATVTHVTGMQEHGQAIEVSAHAALIPEIAKLESVVLITEVAPALLQGGRGALYMQSPFAGIGDYPYWKAGIDGDGQVVAATDSGMSVDAADISDTSADSGWLAPGSSGTCATLATYAGCNNPNNGADPTGPVNCHRKVVCYRWGVGATADYSACDSTPSGRFTHGQLVASIMAGNPVRGRVPAPGDPSPTDTVAADDPNSFRARAYGLGQYIDTDRNGAFSEAQDDALDGIAKGARIVFFDVDAGCPEDGTVIRPDTVATLAAARTEHGATVMNFSWGTATPNSNPVYAPYGRNIDLGVQDHPIMLVAVAAGNDGPANNDGINASGSTLLDNASCKNCLAVGASFGLGGMFNFSSEGPSYLGSPLNRSRISPTILGEGLDNACRSEDSTTEDQIGAATCFLQQSQGTSFSAPNIAGAAALIREYFDQGFYNDRPTKAISSRLVRALMFAGATPIVGGKTFIPSDRFNNVWGYGQLQLTRVLPLLDFPGTVSGLIVHDLPPADINGDGSPDGVSDLSFPGTISGGQSLTADFNVNGVNDDLVVVLVWDDSLGAASETGVLNDNLNLVLRYCGPDGTCGNADDQTYKGNAFSEDPERDGTRNADLLIGGRAGSNPDGWWYTVPDSFITAGGGTASQWVDVGNNSEAVFVAAYQNRPDENLDGTADFPVLCSNADPNCSGGTAMTGKWRIEVSAVAGVPSGRPFAIAVAGPVTAGSTVRFSDNPIVCNGASRIVVEEKAAAGADLDPACIDASACPASLISSRTVVQVLDENSVVRDTETNLLFDTPPAGSLRFPTTNPVPVSVDASAAGTNGVLYVRNGWRVRVRYNDNNGSSTVVRESEATVDCQADLDVFLISQVGRDTYFRLDGGCDDDRYLDQGEAFGLTFQFYNQDARELPDAEIELKVVDADACPVNESDPCRSSCPPASFIRVDNPVQKIGLLPPLTLQNSTFSLSVETPPAPRRRLEFVIGIRSDKAGQGETSCKTFRALEAFQLLAQADDETRYFTTDCQTGCTLNFDRNNDEKLENRIPPNPFDPLDFALRGRDETAINYLSLTTPTRTASCTNCAQNAAVGGPWDFDQNREGFRSGVSQTSKLQSTDTDGCSNWGEDRNWNDVLDSGESQAEPWSTGGLDQNWGTGGGCGFMTGSGPTTGGVWHTGHIGTYNNNGGAACRPNDSICEQYDTNNGTLGEAFWAELLRTPSIHPISLGPDTVDGYEWKTQVLDWGWNMQLNTNADSNSAWTWNFDLDTANAEPILLGSEFIAFIWGNPVGVVTGGQLNILGGGHVFAPTEIRDGNANEGDGVNGTKGNNRAGVRGCWFNDLNLIDLDGSGPGVQTAAWRPTANPQPLDDDCDNEYNLGPNGCPGNCGVDDDGNGQIDDALEICPCFKCIAGSPNAGKPCVDNNQCNTGNTTNYTCAPATNAAGVPTPYGDDICGDGSTDETLAATFGTNTSLRQNRNYKIQRIASSSRVTGNIAYNTLEDMYGPAGDTWAAEVGFVVYESSSSTFPVGSYGMALDDMVVEWQETHPVNQAGSKCTTSTPDFAGQCAQVNLGTYFVLDGDGSIPVTVIDPVPQGNLVDCDGDSTAELEIQALSASERIPETFCLDPVGSKGIEFRGSITTTTRAARAGDKRVYIAYDAAITPTVTVRYFDKNDGKNVVSNGPDGRPGVAGFDDDGDGVVDDADELCPQSTTLAPGRSPHLPGTPVIYSDDTCGCPFNPVAANVAAAFDFADIRIANVFIRDGGGAGTGDGDGFADPNETIQVDVVVRNGANVPLENVTLTLQSSSPYIKDIRDNTISVARLEKNDGGLPGFYDTCDTRNGTNQNNQPSSARCPSNDHFVFTVVPPAGVNRASLAQDLSSSFSFTVQALAKAEAGSGLTVDVPILGTAVAQTFRVIHNLDKPAVTAAPDVVETFENFTNDANVLAYFRPHNTGDQLAELDGNHCQINDPDNPNGNNTEPGDFCQLGSGFDNAEHHWHLHAPNAAGVCEDGTCPDGGRSSNVLSASTGRKSLSSTNTREGDGTPLVGDNMTEDYNRMTWVEWHRAGTESGPGNTFQLGFPNPTKTVTTPRDQTQYTGPELTFWTQLSIIDARMFTVAPQDPGDYAFSSARVYTCVDHNGSGACDTKETGSLNGSEKWEPLDAWYSPETSYRVNNFINCMYDPTDDGSTESQFFPNSVTTGPSSTCAPNAVDTCMGRTRNDDTRGLIPVVLGGGCFPETGIESTDGVIGFAGGQSWTQARWILKRYHLDDFAGRKVLFRWHMTPGELVGVENCADILGWRCGNRDDGWFIDDIRVNGLVGDMTLIVDNAGEATPPPNPTICTPGAFNPALSVLRYPTFDPETNKAWPALACSDPAAATCDFNGDNIADTATDTTESDAPLRPFQLTGITTPSATCVGGDVEYRFRDSLGAVLNNWSATSQSSSGSLIVTPASTTDYFLDMRCSADTTGSCTQTDSVRINVPSGGCSLGQTSLRMPNRTTITWAGSGTFDTAKGSVATLRSANGSFAGAICLENGGPDTSSTDANNPSPGVSFYYLVRCDGGSWEDPAGTGQVNVRGNTLSVCP